MMINAGWLPNIAGDDGAALGRVHVRGEGARRPRLDAPRDAARQLADGLRTAARHQPHPRQPRHRRPGLHHRLLGHRRSEHGGGAHLEDAEWQGDRRGTNRGASAVGEKPIHGGNAPQNCRAGMSKSATCGMYT